MDTTFYDKSIFKKYFDSNDAEIIAWVDNVVNKAFEKGIVPNYIKRGEGSDSVDADYNAYWNAIVTFLAYFVKLSRTFENFKENDYLALQYLINLNTFVHDTETLARLQYVISNRLRDMSRRGTIDSITVSQNTDVADGEVLRLVGLREDLDFFKLGVSRPQFNSWNVNHSGPLGRGCTGRYDLTVGYEYSEDVDDLSVYPILNDAYVSRTNHRGKTCIEITGVPDGVEAGIGLTDLTKKIIINPNQNFEITFHVAQDITYENITFGCKAFDADGNQVALKKITDDSAYNYFFETRRLNQAGRFYFIRGIIYNQDQQLMSDADAKLNIGFGHNLKFPGNAVSIIPYIVLDNNMANDSDASFDNFDSTDISTDPGSMGSDDSGSWIDPPYDSNPSVFIWNVKITPCSTPYNRCYLNNKNFIDVFLVNNNAKYNTQQLKEILRRYFIPYNTAFALIVLDAVVSSPYLLWEDSRIMTHETDNTPIGLE